MMRRTKHATKVIKNNNNDNNGYENVLKMELLKSMNSKTNNATLSLREIDETISYDDDQWIVRPTTHQ